ncbi:MAG: O-antigen ligase family protein [Dehalococcoidia bacterium]
MAGVVLAPLVFSPRNWFSFYSDPKYAVLHLVAMVIIAVWAWEWAIQPRSSRWPSLSGALGWAGRRPERWAVVSVGGLGLSAVISTALSPVPAVSLWGRDFTDLGYELYSFLSLLVVFIAIAIRMRAEQQVRRLMFAFAGVGTVVAIYGIAQRFGWDALGPGENADRVIGSFGNPIHLGSFLVMTAMITVTVAIIEQRNGKYGWLVVGGLALGIQLTALWFTGSRGPWIGYAISVVAFALIGYVWLERRLLIRGMALMASGVLVAVIIGLAPGSASGDTRDITDLGSIFDESRSGSVGGRGPVWRSALELTRSRTVVPGESGALTVARSLTGYGPEMFFYVYPLGVEIEQTGTIAQNAHNYPLQLLMELGLLGFASFIAAVLLTGYAAVRLLSTARRAGKHGMWPSIAIVGLLAMLVGRGTEQMVGVARVGDLLAFWALTALLIAVVEIARRQLPDSSENSREVRHRRPRGPRANTLPPRSVFIAAALTITLLAAGVLYYKDFRSLQASVIARDAFELREEGRPNEALVKYKRAVELNPGVQDYHLQVSDLFRELASEAEAAGNNDQAIFFWEEALEAARRYEDRNSKAFNTQTRMGQAESRLTALGRTDLVNVARERYVSIADARPSYPSIQADVAQGLLAVGNNVLGLEYAVRAIGMETQAFPNPRAWWFRGVALENLGELEIAATSYETATDRAPGSQVAKDAHLRLAIVYDQLGDPVRADEHQVLADAIE